MNDLVTSLLRLVLRLVVGVFAAVMAVSLLLAALIVMAFAVLRALLTGKKPRSTMVFGRFNQQGPSGFFRRATAGQTPAAEVVDVEMREIDDGASPADAAAQPEQRPAGRSKAALAMDPNVTDVAVKQPTRPAD